MIKYKVKDNIKPVVEYKGNVKILFEKNHVKTSLKKHNEGKIGLFTGLTKALSGDTDYLNYIPKFFTGFYETSEKTLVEIFNQPIQINTNPTLLFEDSSNITTISNTISNIIEYKIFIPITAIKAEAKNKKVTKIQLLNSQNSNSGYNVCAEVCDITDLDLKDVTSNILIFWQLCIQNENVSE